jgi:tripartite-type tricarboxylate transporter receptor subunit TctC
MHRYSLQLAVFLVLAALVASVSAQSYPNRPVRLLVPFGPGGVGDITARAIAQIMSVTLGQSV